MATAAVAASTTAATEKARAYPSVRAAAVWAGVAATSVSMPEVRLAATVASAARPMDAPTVRDVLSKPEARPACSRGTPAVPATAIGVTARPMPSPISTYGPRRSATNVLPVEIWDSQASPPPATSVPRTMSGRGPNLRHQARRDLRPGGDQQGLGQEGEPGLERAVAQARAACRASRSTRNRTARRTSSASRRCLPTPSATGRCRSGTSGAFETRACRTRKTARSTAASASGTRT